MQSYHFELIKNSKTLGDRLYYHHKTNSFKKTKRAEVSHHACNDFKANVGQIGSFLKTNKENCKTKSVPGY